MSEIHFRIVNARRSCGATYSNFLDPTRVEHHSGVNLVRCPPEFDSHRWKNLHDTAFSRGDAAHPNYYSVALV